MLVDLAQIESTLGIDHAAACLQKVEHTRLNEHNVTLLIKRDDRLHPVISGNKWRKLKYSLAHALNSGHDHLISMGGAWSNHLHALAYVGQQLNIKTTGLIRGEAGEFESPTLQDMRDWGMQLEFVDRTHFRELRRFRQYNDEPASIYHGYWLPEGAATRRALKGVAELKQEIDTAFDTLCVACGTGTTLAGLAAQSLETHRSIGIAALKGQSFLEQDIASLLPDKSETDTGSWSVNHDYHCGGFAKTSAALLEFINTFEQETGIPLEAVYTGKLLYGIFDLIDKGHFGRGEKIIALHSGGLQGRRPVI